MSALAAELAGATATLASAGTASPRADAEQLAAHVLGVSRGRVAVADLPLSDAARDDLRSLVARRARREPLQHIVGTVGFRYLTLGVGPGVFVPRPETESVAGWAIDALVSRTAPLCVDLCTGSGAIALSLAREVPGARVHAVEMDEKALAWTHRNIAATGLAVVAHHAQVTAAGTGTEPPDALVALADLAGRVDLVVANPPYLHTDARATLEPEVADHDPALALWGGRDGLDVVRAVVATASVLLADGGLLVVEHDDRDGDAAVALVRRSGGWAQVAGQRDLAGRDRFVTARRARGHTDDLDEGAGTA